MSKREPLQLSANFVEWVGETEDHTIYVPTKVYEEHLSKFLENLGIKRQTWMQIFHAALEAYDRQYFAEEAFRADLAYWLSCNDPKVRIRPHVTIQAATHGNTSPVKKERNWNEPVK